MYICTDLQSEDVRAGGLGMEPGVQHKATQIPGNFGTVCEQCSTSGILVTGFITPASHS